MGYIAHDTILATVFSARRAPDVEAFRLSLPSKWQPLVIGPIPGVVNSYLFYAFLPDGSKEGWQNSHDGDLYREQFVELFSDIPADVVHVRFGGDFETEHGAQVTVKN